MTNAERDEKIMDIHGKICEMHSQVRDHHATLYGNGQAGVTQRLANVETRQLECPARNDSKRDNRQFYVSAFALVIAAIALGWRIWHGG